jgi:hypothetical protein
MKKILALSILISMVLVAIPATVADDPSCDWCECPDDNNCIDGITTVAHVVGAGGSNGGSGGSTGGGALEGAPIIKCKWEYDLDIMLPPADDCCDEYCIYHDACPFMSGLQVYPDLGDVVQVGFYAIITDPQGPDHVDHVYADVWHPNGEFKYQIELFPVGFDSAGIYHKGEAIAYWNHVAQNHHSLIAYSDFERTNPTWTDDQDILYELEQEEAYLYINVGQLDYCQPAGYYCVGVRAIDGLDMWSDYLFNQFWYIPTAAAVIDFTTVNYGDVVESTWAPAGGDLSMDTPTLPTVKNVGNTPIYFTILQDDMDFGKTYGNWNVEYKARLSDEGIWTPAYKPEVVTTIPGFLSLCKEDKFDFKIHVLKGLTGLPPTHGTMKICAHIWGTQIDWISPLTFDPAPYGIPQNINPCPCIIS